MLQGLQRGCLKSQLGIFAGKAVRRQVLKFNCLFFPTSRLPGYK